MKDTASQAVDNLVGHRSQPEAHPDSARDLLVAAVRVLEHTAALPWFRLGARFPYVGSSWKVVLGSLALACIRCFFPWRLDIIWGQLHRARDSWSLYSKQPKDWSDHSSCGTPWRKQALTLSWSVRRPMWVLLRPTSELSGSASQMSNSYLSVVYTSNLS